MPTNYTVRDDTGYQHWYQLIQDVNNVATTNAATTNAATSQSDFTWWTREYTAVFERECEPEAEKFDITEVEKYIDSLKKEVVETES